MFRRNHHETEASEDIGYVIEGMRRQMRNRHCEWASFIASEITVDEWVAILRNHFGGAFTLEHEITVRDILTPEAKRERINNLH